MFDFFKPIIDFFRFIVDMILSLIDMVKMAITVFTELFKMLPPQISISAGLLVIVCVLYKILGRENQS
jgi:hypothetical protein